MGDSGNWEAKTPPESLSAMRRAVDANTATSDKALEWAVKTYNLIAPLAAANEVLVQRVERAELRSARPLIAATFAVFLSLAGLACELIR